MEIETGVDVLILFTEITLLSYFSPIKNGDGLFR